MTFQPFGYPFDITSRLLPSDVRDSIRARKKTWFDPKDGARGWVAGSLVCLWFSAFDRQGPMLLGWISRDPAGTKISGRAGSDLDGLLLLLATMPFMAFALSMMVFAGDAHPQRILAVGGFYALICAVVLWAKHMFRRDAEPLVRFLTDAMTKSPPSRRKETASGIAFPTLTLSVNGEDQEGAVTSDSFHDALLGIGPDGFAVLASAPETYLQTAWQDGGFIIEKRDGHRTRHFRALRAGQTVASGDTSYPLFTFDEVLAVFIAYASGTSTPTSLTWETMPQLGSAAGR